MKKVLTGIVALMILPSVGMAGPLTDYSKERTAIDLNWRNSEVTVVHDVHNFNESLAKKYNLDWSVTTGLDNDFAFQYRHYNAQSDDTLFANHGGLIANFELKTQEFNLLHKLSPETSAYLGIMKTKVIKTITNHPASNDDSKDKNRFQVGLIGSTKLADKTTGFASVGVGKDLTTWEIGLSQEISPNLEFNLDYREVKVDKSVPNNDVGTIDVKAKGLGFGLTCKY